MKGKSYLQEERTTQEIYEVDVMQLEYCHNLIEQVHPNPVDDVEYTMSHAILIACIMNELSSKITRQGASIAQQHLLHKGLEVFGKKGHEALAKEINQLYRRNCFSPILVASMTTGERRKAMTALMFLTKKRDSTIKGRMVYNGKPTREWLSGEDSASPTAVLESIMLTAVIEAHKGRDMMRVDIPNTFIQMEMPEREEGEEHVIMKIRGVLVEMMVQLDPDKYGHCVVFEKGKKVVYVQVLCYCGTASSGKIWIRKDSSSIHMTQVSQIG